VKFSIRTALSILLIPSLFLSTCDSSEKLVRIEAETLFDVGYGLAENQIHVSGYMPGFSIDVSMREGIFRLLDTLGRKVITFSSYGDVLSLLRGGSGVNQEKNAIRFENPARLAVDSAQALFIADRLPDIGSRVFDEKSSSFCDQIIRRFDAGGAESTYLGQEGPGGTPFPHIHSLTVLEDNSLAVVAESETLDMINHYSHTGSLISSIRIFENTLPVPAALLEGSSAAESYRIHAVIDSIAPLLNDGRLTVLLKVDYYRESYGTLSGAISHTDYSGTWIIFLDGNTGRSIDTVEVNSSDEPSRIPEMLGVWSKKIILLSTSPETDAHRDQGRYSMILSLLDFKGMVDAEYKVVVPEGTDELVSLKVAREGQVYGLAKKETVMTMFWWNLK